MEGDMASFREEGLGGEPGAASGQPVRSRSELALQGVYALSKILSAPGSLEQVLSRALGVLGQHLDMRQGLIALVDRKGKASAAVGQGWIDESALDRLAALPERLVARVLSGRTPTVVENIAAEPALRESPDWPSSPDWSSLQDWSWGAAPVGRRLAFLAAPILDGAEVIGLFAADRIWDPGDTQDFAEETRFLSMSAVMIGQTLHLYDVIARDRKRLMDDQRRLEKSWPSPPQQGEQALAGIIGASRAIRAVFDQINVVARTHTTILLRGESGTGKEVFARAAHDLSPRRAEPFIRVNCAALSETLLESELFGHEKGAFTGAGAERKGRFELADKGTLFLDEIGEISPAFQAKLLRVLQEGEFERVGGMSTVKVDVRFVFACNRNLEAAVESGEFRADLYYRINVVSIHLPPLRERPEDIGLLAQEFMRRHNLENDARKSLTAGALDMLQRCYFPGNVRELENCVRRAATMARHDMLGAGDFACGDNSCLSSTLCREFSSAAVPPKKAPSRRVDPVAFATRAAEDLAERERLVVAMEKAGWVQAKAARLLQLTPRQIAYALGKHRIEIKKF
jgi:Nif-specific regulatory protein